MTSSDRARHGDDRYRARASLDFALAGCVAIWFISMVATLSAIMLSTSLGSPASLLVGGVVLLVTLVAGHEVLGRAMSGSNEIPRPTESARKRRVSWLRTTGTAGILVAAPLTLNEFADIWDAEGDVRFLAWFVASVIAMVAQVALAQVRADDRLIGRRRLRGDSGAVFVLVTLCCVCVYRNMC